MAGRHVAVRSMVVAVGALALTTATTAVSARSTATLDAIGTGEGPAGPGPDTWTVVASTVDTLTGPARDIPVTLDIDVWMPSSATTATPAPAIIHTHGFGGNKANNESLANAAFMASFGYVVITHSTQGFGGSSGCIGLDSTDYDAWNVRAMVDLLASMPEVAQNAPGDPKVGLMGGSYGGGLQGGAAFLDDRIDAIAIGRSWNALQYSLVPNNWVIDPDTTMFNLIGHEQGVFKQQWTSLFFGFGTSQPPSGNGGCDPITQQTEFPGAVPCLGFVPEVCPIYASLTSTGNSLPEHRETITRTSIATYIDQVTVPTMVSQGLTDTLFTATDAAATFTAQRQADVPTAMIWHQSGHGGYFSPPGEAEPYTGRWDDTPESQAEFAKAYLPRRYLNWMEKHVRGVEVDTGPAFTWFRDWVEYDVNQTGGTAAPAYGSATDFPDPTMPVMTLHLDPETSSLVEDASGVDGFASFLNPPGGAPAAYTETANFTGDSGQGSSQAPTEIDGQHVMFTSAPMGVDMEFTGIPSATLNIRGNNPLVDPRFFTKLYEVEPDGTATLLRRQVAASRVPVAVADSGPVTVLLPPVANLIEAGNSIRLVIASTDLSYYNERTANTLTIASTPEFPSTVSLPLRPAAEEAEPAPEPAPAPASPTPASLPATGGGLALAGLGLLVLTGRRRQPPAG